jgi:type II restriction enzyme
MSAHTQEQFNMFMSQLLTTNATLDFYTDFKKVNGNVGKIAMKLNQLNYLIGKSDLDSAIRELWEENSKVFSVLDILIAVRKGDKKKAIDDDGQSKMIEDYFTTLEGVVKYIHDTGLANVFQDKQVTNLVDYVFGVEVGLDTNARKNRSGHIMEGTVGKIFKSAGIEFRQEVYSSEFPEVHKALGEDEKRFDFVVKTAEKTYLMEVNFYSGGGSKLNEVARAYTDLAPKINQCPNYEFVWITDGIGWESARNKLEEAFYTIPSVYNLTSIKTLIERLKK